MVPVSVLDGIHHLARHLTVGDVALVSAPVVAEVAQMDEHRQHVVLRAHHRHVVLESRGIYIASPASQHRDDVIFQALVVHLDITRHCIIGPRRGPEAGAIAVVDGLHHRVGVEYRLLIAYLIAVVPFLQLVEIHAVFFGKGLHLRLPEAEIACHPPGRHHRILLEIVQRRLGLVFLDGQDARHIDTGKCLQCQPTLEHAAQPAHIAVHSLGAGGKLAADGIPLVDDEDELLLSPVGNTEQQGHQVVVGLRLHLRISLCYVGTKLCIDAPYNVGGLESGHKVAEVEIDDRVLVQMLLERGILRYLQVGKQRPRVARLVVVGIEHLGRHRLAEAAAARHTAEAALREQRAVDYRDQTRLVNVLAVAAALESGIAGVDISSHSTTFDVPFLSINHCTDGCTTVTNWPAL